MNSLDGMLEDLIIEETDQMPFSPPTSGRLYKREKVRRNSGKKSQKEIRQLREMEKSKSMKMPICIKQKYTESNALFSGLGHVDSDVDLDRSESRAIKEKRKKDREDKLKSKTRQQEIFMKREDKSYVSENIASNTAPMDIDTPVVPIKLEGSGRYLTLGMTNKLSMAPTRAASSEQQRPTVLSYTECPNDRLVFFKTFQALINMGSQGKKQKEQKEKERMVPQRQKSSEEHLYVSLVWLGLQAWLNGMSLDEQSRKMEQEREKIPLVLEEIMKFKVKFPQNTGSLLYAREQQCVGDENYLMDISDTYHTMYSNMEMIQQQEFAVIQVERLLQKLDQCEQLFSTAAQFASDYPTYHQREFVHRTEALYLWLNTTKDLCHKMNVLGQVFNISANQGWLYVNFTPGKENDHEIQSRTDIPEIVGGGEEEEEEEEDDDDTGDDIDDDHTEQLDSKKKQSLSLTDACQSVEHHMKVKFQLSNSDSQLRSDKRLTSPINSPKRDLSPTTYGSPPDSSTPLRAPFSSTTLSRASSEASLDGQARSLYRAYVDKGLKKMGLNKMLIRLRDILYRSLKRARQSLEYRSQDMDGEVNIN
ncbi:hypothetical protein DPMN_045172 [Dreissena polymorpha]|uniref:Mitogen-activated protein kinase kinase kinase N-terminal domain-containing protein n=1 Tax=Dreissena polymorpha TaxID=45954 RepID=A0A9D4HX41_DREPO|nr:hypothetical protein DPMN_045172 [Dreissena polymorpha]